MVLPRPESIQRREVEVRMLPRCRVPVDPRDINPNKAVAASYSHHRRATRSSAHDSNNPRDAIEKPHRRYDVDPVEDPSEELIEIVVVVPAADDEDNGEDNVHEQKDLVEGATDVQSAAEGENDGAERGDDAPDPVGLGLFHVEVSLSAVEDEGDDGVEDRLEGENASYPAV